MKIAVSGANGYIAKNLIRDLKADLQDIIPIKREMLYNVKRLSELISGSDVIINLAGSPILQRWTKANKDEIYTSRIETTHNLVKAINGLPDNKKPHTFIGASAIGIYLNDVVHTEKSTSFSHEFVGQVVQDWELASADLSQKVRKVIFRIAPILGKEAATMEKMLPIFKMGLGGKIGSGKQPFPFVHIFDVVNALVWGIQHQQSRGIYNLAAPENIDNKTFTKALAHSVNKPALFTVPGFGLKLYLRHPDLSWNLPQTVFPAD